MAALPSDISAQLVVEILVRDLDRSLGLYTALGFTLERRDGGFAVLRFGDRQLFLAEHPALPPAPPAGPAPANVRILVADVDRVWTTVRSMGLTVEQAIGDRYYGLRDFTALDYDGFGLRFAEVLK